jgi:hypothetical protein
VAWARVTCSQEFEGLGVLDLTTLGYALRLHWFWLAHTNPGHSWSVLPSKEGSLVRAMFEGFMIVQIGNGRSALFWQDRWLDNTSIQSSAPNLCNVVRARTKANRLVIDALHNGRWTKDIIGAWTWWLWSSMLGSSVDCRRSPSLLTLRIASFGNGPLINSTPQYQLTWLSSMANVEFQAPACCAKPRQCLAASFSYG